MRNMANGLAGKAVVAAVAAVLTGQATLSAMVGFEMRSRGLCNARAFQDRVRAETEGDLIWLKAVGNAKVRGIPLVNPVSKAALKQIVGPGMRNLFDRMVDRYIWTVTNTMTIELVGDWDVQNQFRTVTFQFNPNDKGRSAARILNYLAAKGAKWRVVHSVFMAIYNYNLHLERQHGIVGAGGCDDSTHRLQVRIDL
jgi:hypothetical protein